jgi:hypothetical protein
MALRSHNGGSVWLHNLEMAGSKAVVGEVCLQAAIDLLGRYDGEAITLKRQGTLLEIVPLAEPAFAVTLFDQGDQCMITADRWHAHYDDPEQAAWCVFWLLTPYYRIVQEIKGGSLVAAWIERCEADGWTAMDPVYFLNPEHEASWVAAPGEGLSHRILQQDVLRPADYRNLVPGVRLDPGGLPEGSTLGSLLVAVPELVGHTLRER